MFVDEGVSHGVTVGSRQLVDRDRGITFAPHWKWRGPPTFFILTIRGRIVAVETRLEGGTDIATRQPQVHVVVAAIGSTPIATKLGINSPAIAADETDEIFTLAAEGLLVFGWWFDGLEYPDRHFIVKSEVDTRAQSYALSWFGYTGAEFMPPHRARLDLAQESLRQEAVEMTWGQRAADAAVSVYLEGRRRFDQDARSNAEATIADMPIAERQAILGHVEGLVDGAHEYAAALAAGQSPEAVYAAMEAKRPGFSEETYRRCLAHGVAARQREIESRGQYMSDLVRDARLSTLLDGVFALHHFNRREYRRFAGVKLDIHAELGNLYSTSEITAAIAQADQLVESGRDCTHTSTGTEDLDQLDAVHPGFSITSRAEAASWGYQLNR